MHSTMQCMYGNISRYSCNTQVIHSNTGNRGNVGNAGNNGNSGNSGNVGNTGISCNVGTTGNEGINNNSGNSSNSGNVAIGCGFLSFIHVYPPDKQLDMILTLIGRAHARWAKQPLI